MTDSLTPLWKKLEEDRSHGSTELARDVLSELLHLLEDSPLSYKTDRADLARNLRERRPEMTLLVNLGHALTGGQEALNGKGSGRTLMEDLRTLRKRLEQSALRMAEAFRESSLSLESPLIFSRSGTVLELLEEMNPSGEVTVLQSHPGDEGVSVANELAARFEVQFRYDLEALDRLNKSDLLLVGADSYDETGAIRNKVGTELLARASGELPVASCFQTLKYEPSDESKQGPEQESPEQLCEELRGAHPIFERVHADVIDYYVTDRGVFGSVEGLRSASQPLRTVRDRDGTPP